MAKKDNLAAKTNNFFKDMLKTVSTERLAEFFSRFDYKIVIDEFTDKFREHSSEDIKYELLKKLILLGPKCREENSKAPSFDNQCNNNHIKLIIKYIDEGKYEELMRFIDSNEKLRENILLSYLKYCLDRSDDRLLAENEDYDSTMILLGKLENWKNKQKKNKEAKGTAKQKKRPEQN